MGLSLRSKSRRRLVAPDPAVAALASALAKCTSILLATATSGLIASVADILNAASPATQSNSVNQPSGVAAANGLAEIDFVSSDFLDVPCIAARVGSPRWGLALWLRPVNASSTVYVLNVAAGAASSAGRLDVVRDVASLVWDVYHSAFSVRRATVANVFAANTRVFVTLEFDGTQSTEATKAIVTINAIPAAPVFTNDSGSPNNMPATLVQPTGTFALGSAASPAPAAGWFGRMGPAIYIAQPAVSLAGGGIWTPAERAALMNDRRPT